MTTFTAVFAFLFSYLFLRGNVPGEIRTPDPQLRRLLLYPAELLGHGAGEGNRTLDISLEG